MPLRRRRSKRRIGAHAPEWEMVFLSGHDYFRELGEAGIETDEYGRPPLDVIEAAWQRHGKAFLATYATHHSTPWALEQFGQP